MRFGNRWNGSGFGLFPGSVFFGAVRVIVLINILVFVLVNVFRSINWYGIFGLVPAFVFSRLMIWQLVTYLFLNAGIWSLALNMLMLWMFGSVIESVWGTKRFLFYYFLTGIGAGLFSFLFAFSSTAGVYGCSGAIFGLLVAFAVMFPDNIILLFFIFPMKMKYAAIILGLINLLGALSNPGNGVAYLAQLGGGLIGYLYLKNETLRFKLARFRMPEFRPPAPKYPPAPASEKEMPPAEEEIDRILDKISAQGMDSLTPQEKETLKRKSKVL